MISLRAAVVVFIFWGGWLEELGRRKGRGMGGFVMVVVVLTWRVVKRCFFGINALGSPAWNFVNPVERHF